MPRRRTRLRSGKILDRDNRFVVECRIYDRSSKGARLHAVADRPVPDEFRLYEDLPDRLIDAIVVWRKHRELGVRFVPTRACRIAAIDLTCLRGRYYAVDR